MGCADSQMDNPTAAAETLEVVEDENGATVVVTKPAPAAPAKPAPLVTQASTAIFKASKKETTDTDLAAVSLSGKSEYQKVELGFPFCRTPVRVFVAKVRLAEDACGNEGYCDLNSLREQFTSEAWKKLHDPESKLCKLLMDDAFKDPNDNLDRAQLTTLYLIIFGIIHCGGTAESKAEEFYNIL